MYIASPYLYSELSTWRLCSRGAQTYSWFSNSACSHPNFSKLYTLHPTAHTRWLLTAILTPVFSSHSISNLSAILVGSFKSCPESDDILPHPSPWPGHHHFSSTCMTVPAAERVFLLPSFLTLTLTKVHLHTSVRVTFAKQKIARVMPFLERLQGLFHLTRNKSTIYMMLYNQAPANFSAFILHLSHQSLLSYSPALRPSNRLNSLLPQSPCLSFAFCIEITSPKSYTRLALSLHSGLCSGVIFLGISCPSDWRVLLAP